MPFKLTNEFIEELKKTLDLKDTDQAYKLVKELHPADLAEILGEFTDEEATFLYLLLDREMAADVLIEMEEDEREHLLNSLSTEDIANHIMENIESDDAADMLMELPEAKKDEVLKKISDIEQAGDIADLLGYDEDSAGGLMAKELIKVNENLNVDKSLKEIKKQAEEVDEFYYVYVVDNDNVLKGVISLKKLLISRANTKVRTIVNSDIISVRTDTSSEEVASIMQKYDLVSLPVIDQIGRLVGRITIDDVVDVIKEEAEKDYQMISGITEDVEPADNAFVHFRARIPWLLIGLFGGMLDTQVINLFGESIRINPSIVLFFPMIAAMGGNVGVQASSIVVQGIAANAIDLQSTGRKLLKELSIALLNGTILSSLIFVYNIFFSDSLLLSMTVSLALMAVILFASVFGTFVPLALNRFKIDPALATGPFITTVNDIMGIFIYLGIGRIVFSLFLV